MLTNTLIKTAMTIALTSAIVNAKDIEKPEGSELSGMKNHKLTSEEWTRVQENRQGAQTSQRGVVSNYKSWLARDSFLTNLVGKGVICKGTTFGGALILGSCYFLGSNYDFSHKNHLGGLGLLGGISTIYMSQRTNPAIKHLMTGTITATAASTAAIATGGFLATFAFFYYIIDRK